MDYSELMDLIISEKISQLKGMSDQPPGFFGYEVISNIPYIQFPGFSKEQSLFALDTLKEVLITSKRSNSYKEVSITYTLDNPDRSNPETYVVVKGNEDSVSFYEDKRTAELINSSAPLMVVSFHNHLNQSSFSLDDLSIFCLSPQIKLMALVNNIGEVSFIEKQSNIDLVPVLASIINQVVPDLSARREVNRKSKTFLDVISGSETDIIVKKLIKETQKLGIVYHEKISNDIVFDKENNKEIKDNDAEETINGKVVYEK